MAKFFEKLASKTSDVFSNLGSDHSSSKSSKSNESSTPRTTTTTTATPEKKEKKKTKTVEPPTPKPGEIAGTATYIETPKGPKTSAARKGEDMVNTTKKTRMVGKGLADVYVFRNNFLVQVTHSLSASVSA